VDRFARRQERERDFRRVALFASKARPECRADDRLNRLDVRHRGDRILAAAVRLGGVREKERVDSRRRNARGRVGLALHLYSPGPMADGGWLMADGKPLEQ
jgi:hypothetical protein